MRWVVFLRGVNVGKANRCQPAVIASQLSRLGVINIGAVGTFVVREDVSESALRAAIAKKLPFKCEIMICPARDIIKLASKDPWLLKVIAIREKFILGLYRRQMKAIGYLGKIEKLVGVPATTRNSKTIEKIVKLLRNA